MRPPFFFFVAQGTNVTLTALAAMSVRFENEGPGMGVDPDLIKIDARDGRGLLMDYDINLNMKVELAMVRQSPLNLYNMG